MDLTEDQLDLVTAARGRRAGALREVASLLDERLADEDLPLDGAVAAWQVVGTPRTRLGTFWARAWGGLHARRRSDSSSPSAFSARAEQTYEHLETALDQELAA